MKKLVSLFLSAAMVFSAGAAASAVPELPTEPLVASAAEVIYCDLCETEIPEGSEHHTPLGLTICDSCNSAGAGGTTVAVTTTTTTSDAYIPPATDEPIPLIPEYYIDLEVGDYLEFTAELIALDYETNGAACTYENGLLTAVEEGCFSLMFYNEDGSAYAHYNIYVTDPNLPANTAPYIEEGCICTVPVRALAGSTTVTVTCDNEDVAVVDDIEYLDELVNIHILGVSEGTATLTVEDENGYYAEIYVTVYVPEEETTEVVTGTTLAPQDHCDSCGEFVPEGEGVRSPLGMFLCQSCSKLGIGGTTTSYHTTHPDGTGTTTTNHAIGTGTTTASTYTTTSTTIPTEYPNETGTTTTTVTGGTYYFTYDMTVGETMTMHGFVAEFPYDVIGTSCEVGDGVISAVRTGQTIIYCYSGNTLIAEYIVNVTIDESLYEDKLMGDINGDSTVSVSDLVAAARMIAQTDESADDLPVVTENGKICADFNKDGMVDAADLTQISLYLAGIAID